MKTLLLWLLLSVNACAADYFVAHGVRVIDGDTVAIERLDVGYGVSLINVRARCLDFDAWETSGEERPKGLLAKADLVKLVETGAVYVIPDRRERDRDNFGRLLGNFQVSQRVGGKLIIVRDYMTELGHAKVQP